MSPPPIAAQQPRFNQPAHWVKPVSVGINDPDLRRLDAAVALTGETRSAFVRRAIDDLIARLDDGGSG